MIERTEDNLTHVTLGKGTLYSCVVTDSETKKPCGIAFLGDRKGLSEDDIVFFIHGAEGISSYIRPLIEYMKAHVLETDFEIFDERNDTLEAIQELENIIKPFLPLEDSL